MSSLATSIQTFSRLTLRCRPRGSRHLRLLKTLIVVQQLRGCLRAASDQRFGVLSRLPDLHNVLQLLLSDLGCWQNQLAPSPDGLRLLELLNLSVARGDELGLVGGVPLVTILALTLSPLSFLILRFALVLEATKGLTNGGSGSAGLFV